MKEHYNKRLIKVCNVDEEGRFGGPERRIVQVASILDNYEVETTVIYPNLDSEIFTMNIKKKGVKGISVPLTRLTKEKKILIQYAIFFGLEILKMKRLFKKQCAELIHVNGSYQFKVAIAAKLAGVPVVWHLNDTYVPSILKRVFHIIAPLCADGFIVAGQRVKDYYLSGTSLTEKPVKEIHAPVDMSLFDPSLYTRKKDKPEETEELLIGTVSGINPAKGLEYFAETAVAVLTRYPKVRFVVAGAILNSQKKYFEIIKKQLEKLSDQSKVEFCGLVNDVPAFLSKLDICVFSSVTEASPTSIWEAMAMAKPIVTTDVGSVNQHMKNGVSGFIVPIKQPKLIAEKIVDLIKDPYLRKKLGTEARAWALKNLDIDSAGEKHNDIYRKIIKRKNC